MGSLFWTGLGRVSEKKKKIKIKNRNPKGIKCFLIEVGRIPSLTFKKGFDL